VLRETLPLALGAAVYQVNVLVDGWMAEGLLPDGGPTLHYYANRIQQLPLALIPIAASTAVFPLLLALGQRRDLPEIRTIHDRTQRGVAFVLLPAAIGLFALAGPTIAAIFEYGRFGAAGVARCAPALQYLTLALPSAGAAMLATRVYYSLGDQYTPVRLSILSISLNTGLNAYFLVGLGMDIEGLALATAISSWVHVLLLLRGRSGPGEDAGGGPGHGLRRACSRGVAEPGLGSNWCPLGGDRGRHLVLLRRRHRAPDPAGLRGPRAAR
jgi:putative peptidoglycan lipid II flippase